MRFIGFLMEVLTVVGLPLLLAYGLHLIIKDKRHDH